MKVCRVELVGTQQSSPAFEEAGPPKSVKAEAYPPRARFILGSCQSVRWTLSLFANPSRAKSEVVAPVGNAPAFMQKDAWDVRGPRARAWCVGTR